AVLIDRRCVIQDGDSLGGQRALERRRGRLRVGRSGGGLVDEREERCEVVRLHVDLPTLEGGENDLAVAEVELARHGITVGLEDLAIQLPEDELFAEVGGADGDRGLGSARGGTAAGARDKCRHDEWDRYPDRSVQLRNSFRAAAHISRPTLAVSPSGEGRSL